MPTLREYVEQSHQLVGHDLIDFLYTLIECGFKVEAELDLDIMNAGVAHMPSDWNVQKKGLYTLLFQKPSNPGAGLDNFAILKRPLPDYLSMFHSFSQSSFSIYAAPNSIKAWNDVLTIIQSHTQSLEKSTAIYSIAFPNARLIPVSSEEALHGLMIGQLIGINSILSLGHNNPSLWGHTKSSMKPKCLNDADFVYKLHNKRPDLELCDIQTWECHLTGEMKCPHQVPAIELARSLDALSTKSVSGSLSNAKQALDQAYTYMGVYGHQYGFLSTYEATWLLHCPDQQTLYVSPPIFKANMEVTVLEALYWLSLQGLATSRETESWLASGELKLPFPLQIMYPLKAGASGSAFMCWFEGQEGVIKVSGHKDQKKLLENELRIYEHLKDIQGMVVPRLLKGGMTDGGLRYLITQRIVGEPIRLEHSTNPSVVDAVYLAVCCLHAHGVLHADIKHEHIIVRHDNSVILLDFSHSYIFEDDNSESEKANEHHDVELCFLGTS